MEAGQFRLQAFSYADPGVHICPPLLAVVVEAMDIGLADVAVAAAELATNIWLERVAETGKKASCSG
jgi:hypothetical protein